MFIQFLRMLKLINKIISCQQDNVCDLYFVQTTYNLFCVQPFIKALDLFSKLCLLATGVSKYVIVSTFIHHVMDKIYE